MAGLPTAYITATDADAINTGAAWVALDEAGKNTALSWGRVYLDANYSCTIDETAPSDNVQYTNALLGGFYAEGTLFENQSSRGSGRLTKKEKVKAGSVEVEEEFATTSGGGAIKTDPFSEISALLLQDGCRYVGAGSSAASITLNRS